MKVHVECFTVTQRLFPAGYIDADPVRVHGGGAGIRVRKGVLGNVHPELDAHFLERIQIAGRGRELEGPSHGQVVYLQIRNVVPVPFIGDGYGIVHVAAGITPLRGRGGVSGYPGYEIGYGRHRYGLRLVFHSEVVISYCAYLDDLSGSRYGICGRSHMERHLDPFPALDGKVLGGESSRPVV